MTRRTLTSQKLGILLETATTTINPPETQRRGELCLICLQKVPTAPFPGLQTWLFTFDDVWSQSYFRIWLIQWPPWCLRKRNVLIPSPLCMKKFQVADAGQEIPSVNTFLLVSGALRFRLPPLILVCWKIPPLYIHGRTGEFYILWLNAWSLRI